ncbi:MAG: DUF262 domain-containing protein [Rhodobacter sp.]|nr:DUF262 domain-containing protein [Rhodobacter sp.]
MDQDKPIFDKEKDTDVPDPDETPIRDRKVVTQPYDIAIQSLVEQVKNDTIFLRPLSSRPRYQRQYVWTNPLASRLIESILLNVPVPPCYLSQNDEFELDVIDGQQRIYSLFRYLENQFPLSSLEVLKEISGRRFFELDPKIQRQLKTYSLRCVLITNESHPEIKFDVFERLNTNTVPLNAQELRNCIYRGPLNNLLGDISGEKGFLDILGRKSPDKRLRDEELVLRFFAFELLGLESYKTPQKHWLNDVAKLGRKINNDEVDRLKAVWELAISNVLEWFDPKDAFRRPGSRAVNRALFDLLMSTAKKMDASVAKSKAKKMRQLVDLMLQSEEFSDLISRAVDHKKRTNRRFELWRMSVEEPILAG